jgi:hypothetical protein
MQETADATPSHVRVSGLRALSKALQDWSMSTGYIRALWRTSPSMKDPATCGAVLSGGTLLVLAVWKARRLRWLAIAVAALIWVVSGAAPFN